MQSGRLGFSGGALKSISILTTDLELRMGGWSGCVQLIVLTGDSLLYPKPGTRNKDVAAVREYCKALFSFEDFAVGRVLVPKTGVPMV